MNEVLETGFNIINTSSMLSRDKEQKVKDMDALINLMKQKNETPIIRSEKIQLLSLVLSSLSKKKL